MIKLSELCPKCKKEKLEVRNACCEDRAKGWELVKKCPKCGHKERFL